jgi:osmotically-inducible protein OsmY
MTRLTLAPLAIAVVAFWLAPACAEDLVQLDPFERATHGDARCAEQSPPLMRAADARNEAHVRVERGLRCAMAGTCEPGGAYKRDPEINAQVARAIAGERRFVDTSIWVTTTRKWVTLQGCVRSAAQRRAVEQFAKRQPNVERVFDELKIEER